MTGTPKQIKWAEDIKKQVMEAAHTVYEHNRGSGAYYQISFEDSRIGHTATFAEKHMDDARFWIRSIGYRITDWFKIAEPQRSIIDLQEIIYRMRWHFIDYDYDLNEQFFAEEKELELVRDASFDAWCRDCRKKEAAKRAEKERTDTMYATKNDEETIRKRLEEVFTEGEFADTLVSIDVQPVSDWYTDEWEHDSRDYKITTVDRGQVGDVEDITYLQVTLEDDGYIQIGDLGHSYPEDDTPPEQ